MNEILLIFSLLVTYGGVIFSYAFFKTRGLVAFGVFVVVLANIEVNILIEGFGMTQTLGNVLFASLFLITDALSEIRGQEEAKKTVGIFLVFSLLFFVFVQMWLHYLPLDSSLSEALNKVFGQTPRVIIASLVVFAIASYLDVWLYHWWWNQSQKIAQHSHQWLWLRNNGSTLISQLLNAILFNVTAFYGVYEWSELVQIIFSSYMIFLILALLDTPVLYYLVHLAKREYDCRKKS